MAAWPIRYAAWRAEVPLLDLGRQGALWRLVPSIPRADQNHRRELHAELERRGIEFIDGDRPPSTDDGIGVRLNYAKATEFARTTGGAISSGGSQAPVAVLRSNLRREIQIWLR